MGKIKQRKNYAWIMSVIIFIGLLTMPALPAYAKAEDDADNIKKYNDSLYESFDEADAGYQEIDNENLIADKMDNYLSDNGEVVDVPTYSNINLATEYLRKCMLERRSSAKFICKVEKYTTTNRGKKLANRAFDEIFNNLFLETPNPCEGDYLYWHWRDMDTTFTIKPNTDYITITCKIKYTSTAAQEAKVTKEVAKVLDQLPDRHKYITAGNVINAHVWMFNNLKYDSNKYTAYDGFVNKKTGSPGYALVAYRLYRELGAMCKIIASETHAWTLVKIDDIYYNDDVLVSQEYYGYIAALVGDGIYSYVDSKMGVGGRHKKLEKYDNAEFYKKYFVSLDNYENHYEAQTTEIKMPTIGVTYSTHVQSYGWESTWKKNGVTAGTSGQGKRLEAIKIKLTNASKVDFDIEYKTHIQSYGWEPTWKKNGQISGTSGEGKRLEAIKIRLSGPDAARYDVYYRVHAQSYGWLGWAKNGEAAGTAGQAKRLEAIQIKIVKKSDKFTGKTACPYIEYGKTAEENSNITGMVNYSTHVQTYGWQGYVHDGSLSGTYGEGKRLEGIKIKLGNTGISGSIQYRTHVQSYGWMSWKKDGAMSGTSGEAKRLEAIQIKLSGNMEKKYDVYYRVHAQTYGWLGWVKNGKSAGTQGQGKRLEAIQIVLVPKGKGAPTSSSMPGFIQ